MKKFRILIVLILLFFLILIRAFEHLFYDPVNDFFKGDYQNLPLPDIPVFKTLGAIIIRYALNTAISIGIIWVLFKNSGYLKFTVIFYIIAGFILLLSYYLLISKQLYINIISVFYVRRFLAQPIFLLLLIPAFYYQNLIVKKATFGNT